MFHTNHNYWMSKYFLSLMRSLSFLRRSSSSYWVSMWLICVSVTYPGICNTELTKWIRLEVTYGGEGESFIDTKSVSVWNDFVTQGVRGGDNDARWGISGRAVKLERAPHMLVFCGRHIWFKSDSSLTWWIRLHGVLGELQKKMEHRGSKDKLLARSVWMLL